MDKEQIAKKLKEWFDEIYDEHDVENCDTCFTCFNKLCNKFRLKYANGEVQFMTQNGEEEIK